MALIYNPCAEYKFNSGANPCSFEPGKVRGLIFHDKNMDWANALALNVESNLASAAHADRIYRIYPVGGVIAYEGSGGEAQTSQVGYGSTRITGYSEKQMTFTLDERSQNLLASIIKSNNLANYRVMFVDDENRVYGFEGGVPTDFPIEGVPLGGVAVGGQEFETQDNPATLTLTLYINDYADFLANLRNVQVDYDIVDAVKGAGLDWVDVVKTVSGGNTNVQFKMHFGGENITSIVWEYLSVGTPLTTFKAIFLDASAATAVAYNSSTNSIDVTGSAAIGKLASPEDLYLQGVYGIEEWVD